MNSEGTQLYIYIYPFSPNHPSHPSCQITLSRVLCAVLNVLVGYPFYFFFPFILFFYFIFKLYIILLVLPNIKMNPPQVYMWLSILNIAVCIQFHLQIPNYPFPPATISLFSKSVSLFLFCKFICIISF